MRRLLILFLLSLLDVSVSSVLRTKPHIGVTIPLTKRAKLTDEDGVVNVKALKNQLARVSGKMHRGFQAFQRNTGSFHPSDSRRAARRDTGISELVNDDGALWHGTVAVGTPPVSFTVDFDTGSSDFFLPGRLCQVNCEGHEVYDTDASSTATSLDQTFLVAFADGSTVQGDQFTDTVTISNLTAEKQTVGAATRYSTGFAIDEFPPDGLLGMAFPEISVFGASPYFHTLAAQNTITTTQFAFKLAECGSELFLGGVNRDLFTGSLTSAPLVQTGFWQVDVDAVNVNGTATSTKLSAIIDTGTTLILGDFNSVASLYDAIPGAKDALNTIGAGFFTYPCDATSEVSLTFGDRSFVISQETFNLGHVAVGSLDCVGGIAATDNDLWIIGDVFLQNVYTVFDVGNKSVGFGTLARI